jgi:dolichol-phosphate mannosyltransferase
VALPLTCPLCRSDRTPLELERHRDARWRRDPTSVVARLRRRATIVRHGLHVLPSADVLELGAGSGRFTEQLTTVLRGRNPITAVTYDPELARLAADHQLPNTQVLCSGDPGATLRDRQFDYIVATDLLLSNAPDAELETIRNLLKPGGQCILFETNILNPLRRLGGPPFRRHNRQDACSCKVPHTAQEILARIDRSGLVRDLVTYHEFIPAAWHHRFHWLQHTGELLLQNSRKLRRMSSSMYVTVRRKREEGEAPGASIDLAEHPRFYGKVSVVTPAFNEEMNIPNLVESLSRHYGQYIHEIIVVNDNSSDSTGTVTRSLQTQYPQLKLIDRRPPGGVGRALRDGFAAATGEYVLTIDADFTEIVPEFRDLFDELSRGCDGAIGSRFSPESLLVNYSSMKIVCNRGFHALMNLILGTNYRDISNNLKLYRRDIFVSIPIRENHFAANVETGLRPLLAGYDIREVPVSWFNRTETMGKSSFSILRLAPSYALALLRIILEAWAGRRNVRLASSDAVSNSKQMAAPPTSSERPTR